MNSDEIDNKRVEKLKEINATRENLNTLYLEKYRLEAELIKIAESIRIGKHVLAVQKTNVDILTSEFWKAKS